MMLNGSQIIIRCLQEEKVRFVFGYPGGAVLNIYDALGTQQSIQHILTRHEQAAVHAADAYARATGEVGVALVTSGPGATNALTGIATAYYDSIPIVIISGQVPSKNIGQDAFQEVDTIGISRPCVKYNVLVDKVENIAYNIKKAFYLASTGRPGPVLVDIPKDISAALCSFSYPKQIQMRSYNPVVKGHAGQIKKVLAILQQAQRPLIYAGGGIVLANASEQLTYLARLLNIPVTTTLMALGAYPANDPLYLGMPGMHGTYEANMALQNCDVLLAIGARFDDRVIGNTEHYLAQPRQIIHIDVDPASISKRVPANLPIVGDVQIVLKQFIEKLPATSVSERQKLLPSWWSQIHHWRKLDSLKFEQKDEFIKPQYVIQTLFELTKGEAIVSSDVGQHQMWAAQYYRFNQPRQWLNSGGLGTMGVGLPYAMGAQFAKPDKQVFCITGDGSIQMNIQELATCKQYKLPIKICCLNNQYLGMVRQWQEFFYEKRYFESSLQDSPEFSAIARAYGHIGIKVDKASDVKPAILEAIARKNELVFLDFQVCPEENVYPMVESGKGLDQILLRPQDE